MCHAFAEFAHFATQVFDVLSQLRLDLLAVLTRRKPDLAGPELDLTGPGIPFPLLVIERRKRKSTLC